jgi:tetratricopeptide (TPR) repeat protein
MQARTSRSSPSSARAPRLLRAPLPAASTAVDMLDRAMHASTPRARGVWARRGLSLPARIDRTTQGMLLRQLYLSYYEERRFQRAAEVAEQLIRLRVLTDVAHQDAARAKQALGDVDAAAGHLRLAARLGPPSRRAFHWWTLGSIYYLARRYDEALTAISRAARWGTTDKPLYQGHLAVVRCARGEPVSDLPALIERLSEAPSGQGYGRFILGQMAFYDGRRDEARRYLSTFVERSSGGRAALAIALSGELEVARQTLAVLAKDEAAGQR